MFCWVFKIKAVVTTDKTQAAAKKPEYTQAAGVDALDEMIWENNSKRCIRRVNT
jgi:hypothetical protein